MTLSDFKQIVAKVSLAPLPVPVPRTPQPQPAS